MKLLTPLLLVLMASVGGKAVADVNCVVIRSFDQLRHAEIRLARYESDGRFAADLAVVRNTLRSLRGSQIEDQLGAAFLASEFKIFTTFLSNSEVLLTHLLRNDKSHAFAFLNRDETRRNLHALGKLISGSPCNLDTNSASGASDGSGKGQSQPQDGWLQQARTAANDVNQGDLFSLFVGIAGAFFCWRFFVKAQKRQKRRAKRYNANYRTRCRFANKDFDIELLDISGWGTKLSHGDNATKIQSVIEVDIFGTWHKGRVAWNNAHFTGVRFDKPLRQQTVQKIPKASHPEQQVA